MPTVEGWDRVTEGDPCSVNAAVTYVQGSGYFIPRSVEICSKCSLPKEQSMASTTLALHKAANIQKCRSQNEK